MIVRIDGKIILYCKGAGTNVDFVVYLYYPFLFIIYLDTIVFARLNRESQPLMKTTLAHLAVSAIFISKFFV